MSKRPHGSFLFTFRVVVVLAVLLPPLRLLLYIVRDERRGYRLVKLCARAVLLFTGCRVRVSGLEHVPPDGHAMLVSNHASMADAAILLAALPIDFRFIANHRAAEYVLLGAAIRGASAHLVDRGSWRSRAECGRVMVDQLAAGRSLLVFPEGTTADTGGMLPFRSGAFRAAARSASPVVPVVITGTRALFPAHARMLANVSIDIELLPPMQARDESRESIIDLRDRAVEAIGQRLGLR